MKKTLIKTILHTTSKSETTRRIAKASILNKNDITLSMKSNYQFKVRACASILNKNDITLESRV